MFRRQNCAICINVLTAYIIAYHHFQESPTGELADCSLSTGVEPSEQETSDSEFEVQSCDTHCVTEETNANLEEGEDTERYVL